MTLHLRNLPLGKTVKAAYVLTKLLSHRIDLLRAQPVPAADDEVLDAVRGTVADLELAEGVRLIELPAERIAQYINDLDRFVSARVLSEIPVEPGDENLLIAVRAPLRAHR